jgi:hypothetical protein
VHHFRFRSFILYRRCVVIGPTAPPGALCKAQNSSGASQGRASKFDGNRRGQFLAPKKLHQRNVSL